MKCLLSISLLLILVVPLRAEVLVGEKPKLKIPAMDGSAIDLAALHGKLVLIDFWVGRSDLNQRNEETLKDLYKSYNDQGLEIIGICCDFNATQASKYVDALESPWPQHHAPGDWHQGLANEWGVPRLNWEYLIGPDGAVLWIGPVSGAEAAIRDALINHPPQLVDPQTLAKATADLDAAEKALAAHDRMSAVQRFGRIPNQTSKDRAFASRMKKLAPEISQAASELLAEVDSLITAKDYAKAADKLVPLLQALKGLPEEQSARQKLWALNSDPTAKAAIDSARREIEASAQLDMARKLRDDGKQIAAYFKFKGILQEYPATEAAKNATDVVASYESDADFMKQVRAEEMLAKAKAALALADSYRSAGKIEQAKRKYAEIIDQFPKTSYAETAKKEMDAIK